MEPCAAPPWGALSPSRRWWAPAGSAAGQTPGDAARARELYRKGREELTKEGHLPQAYAFLKEAWDLQKSFDTAGNLALVESRLTRFREAAEHATYALAHFPTGGSDAQRKAVDEVLTAARTHVGTVTLRVSADRAAVTLDNQPLGESPIHTEIFVEPGRHTVEASLPGCEPVKDTLRADRGGAHLITLTFSKCGAGGVGGGEDPNHPPLVEPKGPRPLVVAGIVTPGVGLGLGAAFAILSKVKGERRRAAPGAGSAPPPAPQDPRPPGRAPQSTTRSPPRTPSPALRSGPSSAPPPSARARSSTRSPSPARRSPRRRPACRRSPSPAPAPAAYC